MKYDELLRDREINRENCCPEYTHRLPGVIVTDT